MVLSNFVSQLQLLIRLSRPCWYHFRRLTNPLWKTLDWYDPLAQPTIYSTSRYEQCVDDTSTTFECRNIPKIYSSRASKRMLVRRRMVGCQLGGLRGSSWQPQSCWKKSSPSSNSRHEQLVSGFSRFEECGNRVSFGVPACQTGTTWRLHKLCRNTNMVIFATDPQEF